MFLKKTHEDAHAAHAVQDRRIDGRERVYGIFSMKRCRRAF